MKSELIVDVQASEVSIALLEDSRLVSLQKEARNLSYAVGDIYLAKVKKLMPGLNAAFVNVGYEKDAFLHYLDLGSRFSSYSEYLKQMFDDRKKIPAISKMKLLPDIDKHGTISDPLTAGKELMVQIVKEPISSKGPRLTTEISFTGRFLVLIPFGDKISISQKIKSTEEKLRLRQLIESIKPKNFGVIVRTSAEGKRVAELDHELRTLVGYWESAVAKAQKAQAPALIFEEESRIVGMLRDVFSPSFENIYVNDEHTFEQIRNYVALIAPDRKDIVKLYTKDEPIFDHFGITRQIKSSFGKTVSFKSGAYIIIEHTEALHVIDVNSGNRTKATNDQESNALEVNLRAADEIARQLRLRDMGGIIVVDFIDMNKSEHRQQLYDHMREIMANDRARHNILPLSKFGLMQITRQRVRPALDIHTTEQCPSCFGKGEVQPSILFTDTLYEKLEYLVNDLQQTGFIMYVHPFVDAYIKKGLFTSIYRAWRRKLGRKFRIIPDESLAYLQYRVFDKDKQELKLHEEKDMNESSAAKKDKVRKRSENNEAEDASEDAAKTAQQPQQQPQQSKKQKQKQQKQQASDAAPAKQQEPKLLPQQDQKPQQPKKDRQPKQQQVAPAQEPVVATPSSEEAVAETAEVTASLEEPQVRRQKQPKKRRPQKVRQGDERTTDEPDDRVTADDTAVESSAKTEAVPEEPVALLTEGNEKTMLPVEVKESPASMLPPTEADAQKPAPVQPSEPDQDDDKSARKNEGLETEPSDIQVEE